MEKKCKLQRSVCFDEIIKPIIAWKDFLLSSLSVSLLIGNWDTITLLLNCCEIYSLIIIIHDNDDSLDDDSLENDDDDDDDHNEDDNLWH